MRKFQARMGFIKFSKKTLKFLFATKPKKKDVINISKPDHRFKFLTFKEICLYLYINMQVYGGAHFVPIAVPDNCCLIFPLNSE